MTGQHMLLTLLAEIEAFAEVPDRLVNTSTPEPYIVAMVCSGVPYRPRVWLGGSLPPAKRMACSRAARRLARLALVQRITEDLRDRVRYLQPTETGLARALELAGDQADQDAVVEGLLRTRWGRDLVSRLAWSQSQHWVLGPPTLAQAAKEGGGLTQKASGEQDAPSGRVGDVAGKSSHPKILPPSCGLVAAPKFEGGIL
jgi:hypothetical protein